MKLTSSKDDITEYTNINRRNTKLECDQYYYVYDAIRNNVESNAFIILWYARNGRRRNMEFIDLI